MSEVHEVMATGLNVLQEGTGDTLVLLHPVGLDLSCWDAVAERLRPHCQVVRLDLPGHGLSSAARANMELRDYAWAVRDALASLQIRRAHLAGLSFGGMIAQTLAIEFPELCASLIAAGSSCTIPAASRADRAERGRLALREGMSAVVETTLDRWFTPDFLASGGAEPTRRQLLRQDVHGWNAAWQAISGLDTLPGLSKISVPALCIAGEFDKSTSVEAVRLLATSIAGARLEVIRGAPHMMQIERPVDFADLVQRFLATVNAPVRGE